MRSISVLVHESVKSRSQQDLLCHHFQIRPGKTRRVEKGQLFSLEKLQCTLIQIAILSIKVLNHSSLSSFIIKTITGEKN